PAERFLDATTFAAALTAYAATFRPKGPEETTARMPLPAAGPVPAGFAWWRWLGWAVGFVLAALVGMIQSFWMHEAWSEAMASWNGPPGLLQGAITFGAGLLLLVPLFVWWLAEWPRWPAGVRTAAKNGPAWIIQFAADNQVCLDEPNELGDTPL